MKKTIRINISGLVFHIDEDAYEKLERYLKAITSRFSNEQDGKEIITDVEARIAELFQAKINQDKEVINIDDVNSVIEILGNPEVFEEVQDDETSQATFQNTRTNRRFYRDPDNRIIGGVCAGVAHYFNIDPVFIRIAFLFAVIGLGSGILIYIILWFVIPEAKTAAQKLEMKGEPITIENISKTVKDEVNTVKTNVKNWKNTPSYKNSKDGLDKFAQFMFIVITACLKFFVYFFGAIFILVGLSILFAITGGIFFDFNFGDEAPVSFFMDTITDSVWSTMGIIGFILLICIPLISLVYLGIKIIFKIKTKTKIIGLSSFLLWVIGLILTIIATVSVVRDFKTEGIHTESFKLDNLKSDTLYLNVDNQKINFSEFHGHVFNDYRIYTEKGKTILFGQPRLNISNSDDEKIEIVVKHICRSRFKKDAIQLAKEVRYNWQQTDSLIKLSPYYKIPENQKWRHQEIEIIVKLPIGKVVYLDKSLLGMIYDIDNLQHYWDSEMVGHKWIMTPNGLSIYGKLKTDEEKELNKELKEEKKKDPTDDMKKELKKIK